MPRAIVPKTSLGKATALAALRHRRSNQPEQIDNASLPAGSPMHYYCISCGEIADVLDELHNSVPRQFCKECKALNDLGWLEE